MWVVDKFKNAVFNTGGPAMKGGNQSANSGNEASSRILDPFTSGNFHVGTVIRAGAGTYDVTVRTGASTQLTCMLGASMVSYYFGVSEASIPVEGSRVLVYMPTSSSYFGVVVAVLPSADTGSAVTKDKKPPEAVIEAIDLESTASAVTEAAHHLPWEDKRCMESLVAHAGRPHDLFPGNKMWFNEQGVGLAILNLMATLKATDKARIDVSVLDDAVRVISGYFRHLHALGETAAYNDEGQLTQEFYGTMHQPEHDGQKIIGPPNFEDTGNKQVLRKSEAARFKLKQEKQCAKKRFQTYMGYLGDVLNFFVANPDPNQNPETANANSKDQGLMHMHIDSSGRVLMRSASGFSFERWDRLPVPKKKHEPWDPQGDKNLEDPKEKLPFEFDKDHPYGRSLQMRDAMAWRNKSAYQRLHDQSVSAGKKDYYLPEESELEVPKDKYDEIGKAEEKFKENDHRRAYFNVEDDGSIVMRDAWGSEILLRGGNIILNCPGQIELRSGKSIVQLAGHDIITKARKSVDITARDRDVRIKANVNMHILSEGRVGEDAPGGGGIMLESRSENTIGTMGFENPGEQTLSTGIVLKAAKSTVFMQGKVVHASCKDRIILEGKDPNGGPATGDLLIACKNLLSTSDGTTLISAKTGAGILVTKTAGIVYGQSAAVIGGTSLALLKGAKVWIPLMEAPIASDPYGALAEITATIYNQFQVEDDWLMPFLPPDREKLKFTYRSAHEYGTVNGSEVYQAQKFYVYRPMWAQMLQAGHKYIEETLDTWQEYGIDDTYTWPGDYHYQGGDAYVTMSREVNIEDPSTEMPVRRKDTKNNSGTFSGKTFHEYEVVKI